jgi:hypothetical protein
LRHCVCPWRECCTCKITLWVRIRACFAHAYVRVCVRVRVCVLEWRLPMARVLHLQDHTVGANSCMFCARVCACVRACARVCVCCVETLCRRETLFGCQSGLLVYSLFKRRQQATHVQKARVTPRHIHTSQACVCSAHLCGTHLHLHTHRLVAHSPRRVGRPRRREPKLAICSAMKLYRGREASQRRRPQVRRSALHVTRLSAAKRETRELVQGPIQTAGDPHHPQAAVRPLF